MKKFLFIVVLFPLSIAFSQGRGSSNKFSGPIRDSIRTSWSINVGSSFFNAGTSLNDHFSPGSHVSVRFGYHFLKSSKLLNGSIGLQYSEDAFGLKDEKLAFFDGALTYAPLVVDNFGGVQVKLRSLAVPLLLAIHARDVKNLNRFKLELGVLSAFNFKNVAQGITYIDESVKYKIREKFDLDMPKLKFSALAVLSYRNIAAFYEYGIQPNFDGTYFNVARSSVGLSIFIRL